MAEQITPFQIILADQLLKGLRTLLSLFVSIITKLLWLISTEQNEDNKKYAHLPIVKKLSYGLHFLICLTICTHNSG